MKHYIFFLIVILSFTFASCREDSDTLLSYDKYDLFNYGKAIDSYEEQFKAFWTAMNCNYALWDYEAEHGVDWDKTFDVYLPKFRDLDKNAPADDEVFFSLYEEILRPLHDGHLAIQVQNLFTNKRKFIIPSQMRNEIERKSEMDVPQTDLDYYIHVDKSVIEHYEWHLSLFDANDSQYALFEGDIVYYYLSEFNLSDFERRESYLEKWVMGIRDKWFNKVRELHKSGDLGGVIIDVRNNGGGYGDDYRYVLGALQAPNYTIGDSKYFKIGTNRYKTGVGRLDYSYLQDPNRFLLDSDREAISDVSIVVLANCNTASTAEFVCLGAQSMENGCVIGTRTWGAFSTLNKDGYTQHYSGIIGEEGKGPFYLYIPNCAFFSDKGEILEGKGVTPDIPVQLDVDEYNSTGRDTQLERALEYIRTGK